MMLALDGRDEALMEAVLPIEVIRFPVTRMYPSRITSRKGLMVRIVACVYRVDFGADILTANVSLILWQ